ncbi:MAG TPA: winged helix-turn-helix domain-containing protein [Thermoanaerobaculia bacterium]|nr:winged helix-turn-helix domain-containing protein [Thermoanaerobaculia bacterium]
MSGTAQRFRFGEHEFDPATGELRGPAGETRLPPKPARFLALLLERPGELVSRERVRQELWPDQHVELDQVLAYTLRQVRAALGDDGAEPRFIETLPRRGYRFVAVETVGDGSPADDTTAPLHGTPTAVAPVDPASPRPERTTLWSRNWRRLALAALVLLLAVAADWAWRRAAGPVLPIRIALLPLGEPGLESANDPLTEALVEALTAQPTLAVLGPATTARLRGTTRPHTELGRDLGVAFVASGGYRPAERLLFLQLVRTSDGAHVFAHRYRGDVEAVRRQLPEAAAGLAVAAREGRPLH